jgi:hypothetical protein
LTGGLNLLGVSSTAELGPNLVSLLGTCSDGRRSALSWRDLGPDSRARPSVPARQDTEGDDLRAALRRCEKTERQVRARRAWNAAPPRVTARLESELRARKLHKRLHTHRTFDEEQVALNAKAPTCGAFAEPSDGLEPSTPSLPCGLEPLPRVATGCGSACSSGFRR